MLPFSNIDVPVFDVNVLPLYLVSVNLQIRFQFHIYFQAITLIEAGVKVNVIPSEAKAFINYRVHPAQSIDDVIKEARDVIDDDRVSVEVVESFVPSVVTDYSLDAIPFQIIVNSALEVQM